MIPSRPDPREEVGGGGALRAAVLGLLLALLAWDAPAPVAAAQDGQVNVAGVIVDYGDDRVSYALVPFEEESISGFELLDRSGLSLLAIEFGGMGQGLCAIEETGCDVSACRSRLCQTGDPDSPFWQYAQQGKDGWSPSPLGASSSTVTDGAVDAWAWSSDPPAPGRVTLDEIAAETSVDLAQMRSGEIPDAVSVTVGGDGGDNAAVNRQGLVAVAIVGSVAIIGVAAVLRSRRRAAP